MIAQSRSSYGADEKDRTIRHERPSRFSEAGPAAVKSRFSLTQPKSTSNVQAKFDAIDSKDLQPTDTSEMIRMEKDWDRATATYDYIMIPNKPPVRRKHKNVWTDADYSEITAQSKC